MGRNYIEESLTNIRNLASLESDMSSVQQEIDNVAAEYDKQIAVIENNKKEALKPIKERYGELSNNNTELRNQIISVGNLLREYSFFDASICFYIVKLMGLVEGREFTFNIRDGRCIIGYFKNDFFGNGEYVEVLNFEMPFIFYYDIDFKNPILVPGVNFGEYDYVRDYMDALINYRIDNELKMPVNEEYERMALTVMKQYISDNLDFIKEKQSQRVAEKQVEMNTIYEMLAQGDIGVGRK